MQLFPKQQMAGEYGYNCSSYIVFSGITAAVIFKYLRYMNISGDILFFRFFSRNSEIADNQLIIFHLPLNVSFSKTIM